MENKKTKIGAFDVAFNANKTIDNKDVKFEDDEIPAVLVAPDNKAAGKKAKENSNVINIGKAGKGTMHHGSILNDALEKEKEFPSTIASLSINSATVKIEEEVKDLLREFNYETHSDVKFSRSQIYKEGLEKFRDDLLLAIANK